jgi:hypothetical protein
MRALSLTLAVAVLLLLPSGLVADGPDNAKLEELWKTGSLWQVGDNIPKVEAARKEIVAAGDAGLAFIFTKLSSTDGLEYRCLEAVFKGFGAKALPGLYERMANEDVKVRRTVSAMLGVIDDKSAASKMVEHLQRESDLRCKVGHLQTLARWKEPAALDPLIECTRVTQEQEQLAERLKVRIVPLLGSYEDEKAIARLIELLDDPAYFVRDAARDALVLSKAKKGAWALGLVTGAKLTEAAPDWVRRRIALLESVFLNSGTDALSVWTGELLGSKNERVRGDCALFLAGRGYEIWSELKQNDPRSLSWYPDDQLKIALKKETDPYALACIEKALRRFGMAQSER